MKIQRVELTPVAFADPPLRNVMGVHEPWALRTILRLVCEDGVVGLGESFEFEEAPIGGAGYDVSGDPLPDGTLALAKQADAILLGATGDWKYDKLDRKLRPEQGMLRLRKELHFFANLRPVRPLNALLDASTIKAEFLQGTDLLVVRELTGGLYYGKPSEIRENAQGLEAIDTLIYTEAEIEL